MSLTANGVTAIAPGITVANSEQVFRGGKRHGLPGTAPSEAAYKMIFTDSAKTSALGRDA
jgi:hypothetical protein